MRFTYPLAAAALLVFLCGNAGAEGLRVLRSDTAALDVEWTTGETTWQTVGGADGRVFRRPHAPGTSHRAGPGQPDVPSVVRLVGIPVEGTPRVRVLSVDPRSETVPDLAPGPEMVGHGSEDEAPWFSERRTTLNAGAGMTPAAWAEIDGTVWIRGQRLARLVLHPWRYDAARNELVTARRLTVRVDFGESGASRSAARPDYPEWERSVDGMVLNAEVARGWREARRSPAPRGPGDSFASSPNWLKVRIAQTGVYKLDYFTFSNAGLDPAAIDPNSVRVFAGTNLSLDEDYSTPPPAFMSECAISQLDDDPVPDNVFDLNDRFLFYALAPTGWANEFDPARPRTEHVEHPYTDVSYYWITWAGSFSGPPKRVAERSVPDDGTPEASSAPHRVHFEQNNVEDFDFRDEDGWQWENLQGRGTDRLYLLNVDRVAPGRDGTITARQLSWGSTRTDLVRDVELKVAGQVVADSLWNHRSGQAVVDLSGCYQGTLSEGQNAIRVNVKTVEIGSLDKTYTAWFDIEYNRTLVAKSGSYLKFFSAPAAPAEVDSSCSMYDRYGKTTYVLQGFHSDQPTTGVHLFDVTNQHDVVRLTNFSPSGVGSVRNITFSDPGQTGTRWYVATTMEGVLPLAPPEVVNIRGLRSSSAGAKYVVIHHADFLEGAERLARLRRDLPGRQLTTAVIDLQDVYNEFSWGMVDPVAIRDFLASTPSGWGSAPIYVTLVGDAAYDTKKYLEGSPENFLGTYTSRYRTEPTTQYTWSPTTGNVHFYSTDDFFGYIEPEDYAGPAQQPTVDIAIGRYPVSDPEDFDLMLDKLESYLSYESPGQWQNRVILAADDERTLDEGTREAYHTEQVEVVAMERIPPAIDKVKVYLTEYARNEFGKKPEAQEKFIDEFTRGALMTSYTGHGDQNTLAQEEVFVSQKLAELLNENRYTVFSTFSCTVSRFDLLSGNSMTELLLLHPDGGAVTTYSSGGLVYPPQSFFLHKEWLGAMFGTPYPINTYARTVHSIGMSAIWAKAIVGTSAANRRNNEKYVLLGDPALEVRYGSHPIVFDSTSVHTEVLEDLGDNEDVLRVVRGAVVDSLGRVLDGTLGPPPFNGTAYVHVTGQADASGYDFVNAQGGSQHVSYVLDGATAFRGEVPVTNGRFDVKFFLSSAVQSGNQARISVFALEDGAGRGGSGATDSLYIAPTILPSDVADSEGPRVVIAFEGYENFVNGDYLFTARPVLVVNVEDESGVNLQPYPEFALLAAQLDGSDRIDLSEDFSYQGGSFTQGKVRRILSMAPGSHTLEVKAFDNVGNRGSSKVSFTVVLPSDDFDVEDRSVVAYPSPFVNWTDFLFRLTHDAEVDLKVFTIAGRKIYETGPFSGFKGENRYRWDGRDDNGRVLANGTYLFKVEAAYTDPDGETEFDDFVGHVVKMR